MLFRNFFSNSISARSSTSANISDGNRHTVARPQRRRIAQSSGSGRLQTDASTACAVLLSMLSYSCCESAHTSLSIIADRPRHPRLISDRRCHCSQIARHISNGLSFCRSVIAIFLVACIIIHLNLIVFLQPVTLVTYPSHRQPL